MEQQGYPKTFAAAVTATSATLGGPSTPPPSNIRDAAIPKEWRYDPGREMFAPRFTRYENLGKIRHNRKPAIATIKDTYHREMNDYQLTQAEWDVYVSHVTGDKIEKGKENAYANMPVLFSTLSTSKKTPESCSFLEEVPPL